MIYTTDVSAYSTAQYSSINLETWYAHIDLQDWE